MHVFRIECANEEDLVGSRTDVAILSILMLKDPLGGSTNSDTFTVQSLGGELFTDIYYHSVSGNTLQKNKNVK